MKVWTESEVPPGGVTQSQSQSQSTAQKGHKSLNHIIRMYKN